MDHLMEMAWYMVKRIKEQPDKFELMLEPEMVNVSFWYVPQRLRSMPPGPEREQLCGQVSHESRVTSHGKVRNKGHSVPWPALTL